MSLKKILFSGPLSLLMLALAVLASAGPALAEEVVVVAVAPFTVHSEKDLSFLQKGVQDMLASRLGQDEKVRVVDTWKTGQAAEAMPGAMSAEKARKLSKELKADYFLFGSLTSFGGQMSLDATLVPVETAKGVQAFHATSPSMAEVIPQVNNLAEQINREVFGLAPAGASVAAAPAPAAAGAAGAAAGVAAVAGQNIYAHPDKLLTDTGIAQPAAVVGTGAAAAAGSPFIMGANDRGGYWKSHKLKARMEGMALGDVDGDGKTETVITDNNTVYVYRMEQGRFYTVGKVERPAYFKFLWVDVADADADGLAEIFVSALNTNGDTLESFVLEWDGSRFAEKAVKQRWYFRALNDPRKGVTVYGQRKGLQDTPLLPGVFELTEKGGQYVEAGGKVPRASMIFGFTVGPLVEPGRSAVATLSYKENKLRLYSWDGEKQWSSDEDYGGGEKFIRRGPDTDNRIYIPQRMIVLQPREGRPAGLLVVKSKGTLGNLFERYRRITSGFFETLQWDGLGMSMAWQTRKVSGYISDYAVGDFDNDGGEELVATVISKSGGKGTHVIAYDLEGVKTAADAASQGALPAGQEQ